MMSPGGCFKPHGGLVARGGDEEGLARVVPPYGERVMFAALLGLTAVAMISLGDAVWWRYPWAWKMSQYGLVSFVIAGAILGKFIKPGSAA